MIKWVPTMNSSISKVFETGKRVLKLDAEVVCYLLKWLKTAWKLQGVDISHKSIDIANEFKK